MPTSYDLVQYPSLPFDRSHPDQLAVMATLFGLQPAPPQNCRVLEIACADGGNIIPMACELPGSSFRGFDLARTVVENGQKLIGELELSNIRIDQMDLMDAGPELGEFDYIIAHGLYSWVPEPVRDKLMSVTKSLLAPQGVAYISFNALPGCRIREMFREMLLIHLRDVTDPEQRIKQAREFLECLKQSKERSGDMGNFLRIEAEFLLDQGPVVLFHDELGEVYHPVFVHDFAAHARRFGLQFLAEASFPEMQAKKFPQEVLDRAEQWCGGDRVMRELYYDFMRGRVFRRTLLCHDNIQVAGELIEDRIGGLFATSQATPTSSTPNLKEGVAEEFTGIRSASAKTAHPLAKAALVLLGKAWPQSLSFDDLVNSAARLIGEQPDPESMIRILFGTYAASLVELHAMPPRCVTKAGPFPATTALARLQAQRGKRITTLRHTSIEADGDIERHLVTLLDGTRNFTDLVREMAPRIATSRDEAARRLQDNLQKLARFGLLVA
jgi:methyltransferase-like protein